MDYTNNEYTEALTALIVATVSGIKSGIEAANKTQTEGFSWILDQGVTFQVTKTIRDGDNDVKTVAEFQISGLF